jgi:hypothetical protein
MRRFLHIRLAVMVALSTALTQALAVAPVPISAEQAFDAVQTQTDPRSGTYLGPGSVKLVDVRSRAEYYFVGTAAQVDRIVLRDPDAAPIVPHLGKVTLVHEGKFLEFAVNGRSGKPQTRRLQVEKVASLVTSPIAVSIPYRLWNEQLGKLDPPTDPGFAPGLSALADQGVSVLIVFCRSGGRSTECIVNVDPNIAARFSGIYEIDDPGGVAGFGGFEGSGYGEGYNGYLGFPGRLTGVQNTPSASWKDAGLPIKINMRPVPAQ